MTYLAEEGLGQAIRGRLGGGRCSTAASPPVRPPAPPRRRSGCRRRHTASSGELSRRCTAAHTAADSGAKPVIQPARLGGTERPRARLRGAEGGRTRGGTVQSGN